MPTHPVGAAGPVSAVITHQVGTAHDQSQARGGPVPRVSFGSAPLARAGPGPASSAPLVTTSESPAPAPPSQRIDAGSGMGAYAPGLEPAQTMLKVSEKVIDYRLYRLPDTTAEPTSSDLQHMYRLKKQVDGLYPALGAYSGAQPVHLLEFLTTFKEAMIGLGKSEGCAVRVLAYFLEGDAKDVYQAQTSAGAVHVGDVLSQTWPYVVHHLLIRFLTDDVLQEAHDAVARATQRDDEDEVAFAQRIEHAARDCHHVFAPVDLVSHYVRGLKEAVRERVQELVRGLPLSERSVLAKVRSVAASEGRAQRAMFKAHAPSTSSWAPSRVRPSRRQAGRRGRRRRPPC